MKEALLAVEVEWTRCGSAQGSRRVDVLWGRRDTPKGMPGLVFVPFITQEGDSRVRQATKSRQSQVGRLLVQAGTSHSVPKMRLIVRAFCAGVFA